ncbi:FbpB family small basic protein [Bacillus mangrovi]|uniref:FbpB family small basic protein n=1 Tax=Metabacillus mangrovi TaxID=1491830 RepID=A0A7X2V431_9BACI|nr:FbpB family small basic protein [Metabacillus mangrovi]MTH52681.1 FbpB family small basic protein [Metabacillus mangrovi]
MRKYSRYSMEEFIRINKEEITRSPELMDKLEKKIEERYTVVYPQTKKVQTGKH